jgi:antitoxin component HigA of HigAB toxin-antitoxin module
MPTGFKELNAFHPLRPIHNDKDLESAMVMTDRLAVLERRTKDQGDYLEALATLIEKYESERHEIKTSDLDPVETLKHLMADRGMSAAELGRVLGHRSLGYAILGRTRRMSPSTISKLAKHFHVGPGVFMKA